MGYVLAIEHNWRMRKLIRANLEVIGLQVRGAVSWQHGLNLLREGKVDLILVDMDVPGVDTIHLLDALHVQLAGQPVPIIVMSAEPPSRRMKQTGRMVSHLLKPFTALALLQQVQQALGHSFLNG